MFFGHNSAFFVQNFNKILCVTSVYYYLSIGQGIELIWEAAIDDIKYGEKWRFVRAEFALEKLANFQHSSPSDFHIFAHLLVCGVITVMIIGCANVHWQQYDYSSIMCTPPLQFCNMYSSPSVLL